MRALADRGSSIAPDLPGFGRTPPLPDVHLYTHRGIAAILSALLDEQGVATCDVIAHSYGCGPAIHLAHAEPQRVRRVILSNFSTFRSERERGVVRVMHRISASMLLLRRFRLSQSRSFARLLGRQFFVHPPSEDVLMGGLDDFLAMDARAAHETMERSLGWDTHEAMAALTQPVLLIHSRGDRIMPPGNAEYTARLAPRGELRWIDDCGHMPMVEKPEEFRMLVREWLSNGDSPADVLH